MDIHHVLVVDDQKDIRRVLSSALQTLGHQFKVTEVPSAEEAMLIAPRQGFDLVVTDVRLPGMSGLDLVKRLRKFNPNLKIILLTGASDFQTRKQVEEAGTFAFFYKPIELADFLDAVERALGLVATAFSPPPLSLDPVKKTPAPPPQSNSQAMDGPVNPLDAKTEPALSKLPVESSSTPANPLTGLVSQLNAQVVFCLDIDGSIIIQAGSNIEFAVETAIITAALRVTRSNTSLSHALGRTEADYLLALDGSRYHVCLAPVGRKHILLALAMHSFRDQPGEVEKQMRLAAAETLKYLNPTQVLPKAALSPAVEPPVQPVLVSEPVAEPPSPDHAFLDDLAKVSVSEADLAAIDELFSTSQAVNKDVGNLNNFWDAVAEEAGSLKQNEAHLTYEQARKLGLAPDH